LDAPSIQIDRQASGRLRHVGEKCGARQPARRGNFGHGLDRPYLVINRHDDRRVVVIERVREVVGVDHAVRPDRRPGHFQIVCARRNRLGYAGVLDRAGQHASPVRQAADRDVGSLRSAAGEINLLRLGADKRADLTTRGLNGGGRRASKGMGRVRVGRLRHPRKHGVEDT
jgi:hypothetical protein